MSISPPKILLRVSWNRTRASIFMLLLWGASGGSLGTFSQVMLFLENVSCFFHSSKCLLRHSTCPCGSCICCNIWKKYKQIRPSVCRRF